MLDNHRRGLLWRVAAVLAVLVLVILWCARATDPGYVVQVQFGIAPEVLTGAEVVIDGEGAGTLRRTGGRTVTSFEVPEGDHAAELRLGGCTSETVRFTAGFGGRLVTLAWYPDVTVQGADTTCVLRGER